jgi:hypothetical protein
MRFGKHRPFGAPRHDSVRGARGQLRSADEDKREWDWKDFEWRL